MAIGHDVTFAELDLGRSAELRAEGFLVLDSHKLVGDFDVAFICVPTPSSTKGYDFSALIRASQEIATAVSNKHLRVNIVAVRSTVAPGTTSSVIVPIFDGIEVKLACVPEYLRQKSADSDARNPRIQVVGSPDEDTRNTLKEALAGLGTDIFVFNDFESAELAKSAHNALNATKISFFNEIARIAEAYHVDADAIARAVVSSAEASWNPLYGTRSGEPFSGTCLPKDLDGLIANAEANSIDPLVLKAVRQVNENFSEVSKRN